MSGIEVEDVIRPLLEKVEHLARLCGEHNARAWDADAGQRELKRQLEESRALHEEARQMVSDRNTELAELRRRIQELEAHTEIARMKALAPGADALQNFRAAAS